MLNQLNFKKWSLFFLSILLSVVLLMTFLEKKEDKPVRTTVRQQSTVKGSARDVKQLDAHTTRGATQPEKKKRQREVVDSQQQPLVDEMDQIVLPDQVRLVEEQYAAQQNQSQPEVIFSQQDYEVLPQEIIDMEARYAENPEEMTTDTDPAGISPISEDIIRVEQEYQTNPPERADMDISQLADPQVLPYEVLEMESSESLTEKMSGYSVEPDGILITEELQWLEADFLQGIY